jgi:rRNA maturation endonuclease Nob1
MIVVTENTTPLDTLKKALEIGYGLPVDAKIESFMQRCKSCGRLVESFFIEGNRCAICSGNLNKRRKEFLGIK